MGPEYNSPGSPVIGSAYLQKNTSARAWPDLRAVRDNSPFASAKVGPVAQRAARRVVRRGRHERTVPGSVRVCVSGDRTPIVVVCKPFAVGEARVPAKKRSPQEAEFDYPGHGGADHRVCPLCFARMWNGPNTVAARSHQYSHHENGAIGGFLLREEKPPHSSGVNPALRGVVQQVVAHRRGLDVCNRPHITQQAFNLFLRAKD